MRKAFFGLRLSRDSLALLSDATDKLDKAIAHLEREIKNGNADEIDLYPGTEAFRFELEGRKAEARRYIAIALSSLRFLTGEGEGFDIIDLPLRVTKRQLSPVATYLQAARVNRPEVNMVRAGLIAREARIDLARSRFFPDIGLGLSATYSRAPEVADQLNPFVKDDGNFLHYGAALVLRWQMDFLQRRAGRTGEGANGRAPRDRALRLGWHRGRGRDRVRAGARRHCARASLRISAKNGAPMDHRHSAGNHVGTKKDADIVDAARQWAMQKFNHLTAMMDVNLAWSNLALATAWDDIAPTP